MAAGRGTITAQETGESAWVWGLLYTVSVPQDDRVLELPVGYD